MKKLLEQKKEAIIISLKKFLLGMPFKIRFQNISVLIVESGEKFPICFSLSCNEDDSSQIEVLDLPASESKFPEVSTGAVIFHAGNFNSDWNVLEKRALKKVIKTAKLELGNFVDLSVSVFGVNKNESIFLSALIASIIFEIDIKSVFEKMENLPSEVKSRRFYLKDFAEEDVNI